MSEQTANGELISVPREAYAAEQARAAAALKEMNDAPDSAALSAVIARQSAEAMERMAKIMASVAYEYGRRLAQARERAILDSVCGPTRSDRQTGGRVGCRAEVTG